MVEITAKLVKSLRDATNVSMMECKKALVDSEGDVEKATKLLRERGVAVAAKRAGRVAQQGMIASATTDGGKTAALVEVNCETDFVARNSNFAAFVNEMAERACQTEGSLAEQTKDEVTTKIAEIGENIVVRRNALFRLQETGVLASYIHLGGKVGVLLEVGCTKEDTLANESFTEIVKDLTLHIAAYNPRFIASSEIPPGEIAAEREIYAAQVENKPPQIVEKIVDGKLRKFFSEVCLLDQEFVKEPKEPVQKLLKQKGAELDDTITVRRFVRYQLGG